MNKSELVEKVAQITGYTKSNVDKVITATLETIKEALKNDDTVKLVGFGTFAKKYRKERTGRNPQTGEVITIKAQYYPSFNASKSLKDMLN